LVRKFFSRLFGRRNGRAQKAAKVNEGLRESPAKEFDGKSVVQNDWLKDVRPSELPEFGKDNPDKQMYKCRLREFLDQELSN
jgi:hypothetical protein